MAKCLHKGTILEATTLKPEDFLNNSSESRESGDFVNRARRRVLDAALWLRLSYSAGAAAGAGRMTSACGAGVGFAHRMVPRTFPAFDRVSVYA